VDNWQYRFLRDWTPGPYTFVLPATREVPRRLWHPSRKTIGLRVPSSPVAAGLLEAHGAPLLGSSLILPGESDPLHDPDDIVERLARRIDAVVDAGGQGMQSTTVVDLTGDDPDWSRGWAAAGRRAHRARARWDVIARRFSRDPRLVRARAVPGSRLPVRMSRIAVILSTSRKAPAFMSPERVVSGMRPTGALHLGHYHGALKNWVRLQSEHPCLFFVADWHALTTHYDSPEVIEAEHLGDGDRLAGGRHRSEPVRPVHPESRVPEHAELHLLLSMSTPLGWLERVPTYKDQQEKLSDRDLATYGFLGYPLLQAADILMYRAAWVPVGEDQVPHVELTREVARRFNHLFGREAGFEEKAKAAIARLGGKRGKLYAEMRTRYQEQGDEAALQQGRALLDEAGSLALADRERLIGYLAGSRRMILSEPQALLTEASRMPGIDGQKMSKSYGNSIAMREDPASVTKKIRTMPTDPARVRRTDPGDPERCPVWQLHQVYSSEDTRQWVQTGCRSAGIGCLDCKQPVVDAVVAEQQQFLERAQPFVDDPALVRSIIADGCDKARRIATRRCATCAK
jgi:tryptophanyl-tRNA synthetase